MMYRKNSLGSKEEDFGFRCVSWRCYVGNIFVEFEGSVRIGGL